MSRAGDRFVAKHLSPRFRRAGKVTVLTNLTVDNLLSLATDPAAVRGLTKLAPRSGAFHLPGLHAKVYVADCGHAIITSGNLTSGGLGRNYEYGVEITDRAAVESVRADMESYSQLGVLVPDSNLANYCRILASHPEALSRRRVVVDGVAEAGLRDGLTQIGDDLLGLRLATGPVHAVFAETIAYVLRQRGPLRTVQIHEQIRSIHPDLCDMSVDRVINGRHFGKKWKHAVRTAQQQLKKQGRVSYADGLWRLDGG